MHSEFMLVITISQTNYRKSNIFLSIAPRNLLKYKVKAKATQIIVNCCFFFFLKQFF